ncbi:hypothetical protein ABIB30_000842 [Pedobacter sp. UYP1]
MKELLDLLTKTQNNFDDQYDLFITEKLPNNKYKTNQVKMPRFRRLEPNYQIIKKINWSKLKFGEIKKKGFNVKLRSLFRLMIRDKAMCLNEEPNFSFMMRR